MFYRILPTLLHYGPAFYNFYFRRQNDHDLIEDKQLVNLHIDDANQLYQNSPDGLFLKLERHLH